MRLIHTLLICFLGLFNIASAEEETAPLVCETDAKPKEHNYFVYRNIAAFNKGNQHNAEIKVVGKKTLKLLDITTTYAAMAGGAAFVSFFNPLGAQVAVVSGTFAAASGSAAAGSAAGNLAKKAFCCAYCNKKQCQEAGAAYYCMSRCGVQKNCFAGAEEADIIESRENAKYENTINIIFKKNPEELLEAKEGRTVVFSPTFCNASCSAKECQKDKDHAVMCRYKCPKWTIKNCIAAAKKKFDTRLPSRF